jgi:hypothetical protein
MNTKSTTDSVFSFYQSLRQWNSLLAGGRREEFLLLELFYRTTSDPLPLLNCLLRPSPALWQGVPRLPEP